MLDISDVVFDEDKEMSFVSNESGKSVRLVIVDSLWAYGEELTDDYRRKIVDFINCSAQWYSKAVQAVCVYGLEVYGKHGILPKEKDVRLMCIYVRFEQKDSPFFGLEFRTEYDVEHGCGLQIKGETFEIIKAGTADIAFC